MIEIQSLRDDRDGILNRLQIRGLENAGEALDKALALDGERRKILTELEGKRQTMNQAAKSIGKLMAEKKMEEAEEAKATSSKLKGEIKTDEESLVKIEADLKEILVSLPNPPDLEVPPGREESDNKIVFNNDRKVDLPENPKPHWDLCRDLDIIDWELGVKLTGAGFPVYKGKGAQFQRALIRFFLERAEAQGYVEIQPPLVVNADSGFATGQLPDKEGQMYHVTEDDLYLIPTAEVPITNLYRDVILNESDLPIKNCGYTPCFRREAGSYGKDVRGLNRLHQFDKVEIVQIAKPEESYQKLDEMVEYVKGLLEQLELPFRVALLCGGDLGFASAKTYDMEVFSAAQDKWLEVSSISNFETFQSNRLKLRYRTDDGTRLVHTLNGSALALPRIFASIIENNQQADGTIKVPAALQPYTGFDVIS